MRCPLMTVPGRTGTGLSRVTVRTGPNEVARQLSQLATPRGGQLFRGYLIVDVVGSRFQGAHGQTELGMLFHVPTTIAFVEQVDRIRNRGHNTGIGRGEQSQISADQHPATPSPPCHAGGSHGRSAPRGCRPSTTSSRCGHGPFVEPDLDYFAALTRLIVALDDAPAVVDKFGWHTVSSRPRRITLDTLLDPDSGTIRAKSAKSQASNCNSPTEGVSDLSRFSGTPLHEISLRPSPRQYAR